VEDTTYSVEIVSQSMMLQIPTALWSLDTERITQWNVSLAVNITTVISEGGGDK
jgi:hypothetical protein